MAKPIKETPILTGRDAVNFFNNMEKAKTEKVPDSVRQRMKSNYLKLKAIQTFE